MQFLSFAYFRLSFLPIYFKIPSFHFLLLLTSLLSVHFFCSFFAPFCYYFSPSVYVFFLLNFLLLIFCCFPSPLFLSLGLLLDLLSLPLCADRHTPWQLLCSSSFWAYHRLGHTLNIAWTPVGILSNRLQNTGGVMDFSASNKSLSCFLYIIDDDYACIPSGCAFSVWKLLGQPTRCSFLNWP